MLSNQYIAVDFGASSGRVMLAEIDQTIHLQEMHRFPNYPILNLGHSQWDLLGLFNEMKQGLSKIASSGTQNIQSIGVDTWGVDFGFIGRDDVILGNPYCYRDSRTQGMMEKAFQKFSKTGIYSATGVQFMELNSLFQLLSMVEARHPILDVAETLLFMPDLFHFMLTGERKSEYTIASTSQLLNALDRQWDVGLFNALELPINLMADLVQSGSVLGSLRNEIQEETGLKVQQVIAPASHDTASAVAAVPAVHDKSWAYLSSGTWSLMGVELETPLINSETLERNYTNEGGVDGSIRFLKNVTGMWLLEECRRQWGGESSVSYDSLLKEADASEPFRCLIYPDDPQFVNPPDMVKAIQDFCKNTNQPTPESQGQFIRCIFESLALRYRQVIEDLNYLHNRKIEILYVVGGGSRNTMLNQFTADALGIPVLAGPIEATALGNVIIQAVATGQLESIQAGRRMIADSFPVRDFLPHETEPWDEAYERFHKILKDS
ncbi:rhamnulokinase [candidate division KSB1 bacterium]|nr:rhamnulokinase [candidate division KSB1 bacterium]